MGIGNRVKKAVKCLLGKETAQASTHFYKLQLGKEARFEGKAILVTGGTGAIGSAICYELAASGATVGMCGRTLEKINNTIEHIRQESPQVANNIIPVVLDVLSDEQIASGISDFVNKCGAIYAMVNNAGGQPGRVGTSLGDFSSRSLEQVDLILDTNLRGTMVCSKVVAPYLMQQRMGCIINIGSVIGMGGKSGMSDYAAAKAGVIGFTKSLAIELGEYNVRVNCVSPGIVHQVPFDGGTENMYSGRNALHRVGYTSEVADLVCYLLANTYITGQNYAIDGGRTIGLFGD